MKRTKTIDIFAPRKQRPEKLDFRVPVDIKRKYKEMTATGAKELIPEIAEHLSQIIEQYYESFKDQGHV